MFTRFSSVAIIAAAWLLSSPFAAGQKTPVYPEKGGEPDPSLVLKEVRTASDRIIVALFTSDIVDLDGIDISKPEEWKLGRKNVVSLHKWVTEAEGSEHRIYIEVPTLKNRRAYTLKTPYGKMRFRFKDKSTLCESIKVNQVGYSALSEVRFANFAIWTGDGGSQKIEGALPSYSVLNSKNKVVSIGTLTEIGSDASSGDYVYRIDLSSVPEGGPYRVSVKGYGVSYPFGVGGDFSKKVAWNSFRALYHQRCGVPVVKPYAEWDIRTDPCHETIYLTYGPIGEARLKVEGTEPTISAWIY